MENTKILNFFLLKTKKLRHAKKNLHEIDKKYLKPLVFKEQKYYNLIIKS